MTDELAHHAITVVLDIALDGPRDIDHPVMRQGLGNAQVERLFCHIHQPLGGYAAATYGHGAGGVADETVIHYPDIQADDVSELEPAVGRQPVHHLLVDRDAQVTRKLPVTQEGASGAIAADAPGGKGVNLLRRHARFDEMTDFIQDRLRQGACRPHQGQVLLGLKENAIHAGIAARSGRATGLSSGTRRNDA